MLEAGPLVWNFWYLVLPSTSLAPGRTISKKVMGLPLLLGRAHDGSPFALLDICPHRGIPLRYGEFDGKEVTCCYHGWKFDIEGRCTEIPSLMPDQDFGVSRVSVRSFPCRDVQGSVWVYFPEKRRGDEGEIPEPPLMPDFDAHVSPRLRISMPFPCDADHAAFGLMDPTHAAFVHTSWWFKKQARKLREKQKEFEPAPLGWRMKRHRLPPQNRVYKIFGHEVTTEISYQLPGIRIEHIKGEAHTAVGLTAITPLDENETEVFQIFYWTIGWLGFARPLLERLSTVFLKQDRDVVVQQQEGLVYDPPLMLVDDADTQAKWYHKLKAEWIKSREEGRPFANPLEPATLRWRS